MLAVRGSNSNSEASPLSCPKEENASAEAVFFTFSEMPNLAIVLFLIFGSACCV